MPVVPPFHSDAERPEKYHDNSTCGPGRQIRPQDKKSGTGGKPHCNDCIYWTQTGK